MKDELLTTLLDQHIQLKNDLGPILKMLENQDIFNAKTILENLNKFYKDLKEHLELENKTFYVKLLLKMEQQKMATENTIKFIEEMKNIEKVIIVFLKKYDNESAINDNMITFEKEMTAIKNQLLLRVESEEEGVYMYWETMV